MLPFPLCPVFGAGLLLQAGWLQTPGVPWVKPWDGPPIEGIACQADVVFQGKCDQEHLGQSVACGGDWNGDGAAELLLGGGDKIDAGLVITGYKNIAWIALGPVGCSGSFCLGSLELRIEGEQTDDRFGHSWKAVGDLDLDGLVELAAGAPLWDRLSPLDPAQDAGAVYLFRGRPSSALPPLPASVSAAAFGSGPLDAGLTSLVLRGESQGDRFGMCVSSAGDLDGDGRDELIVGAPGSSLSAASAPGRVYIFRGAHLAQWMTQTNAEHSASEADFVLSGKAAKDRFGSSLALLADTNGDHRREFAVGATQYTDVVGEAPVGPGYARIFGSLGSTPPQLFAELQGATLGDRFGYSLVLQQRPTDAQAPVLLVGAPLCFGSAPASGRVYRFALAGLAPGGSAPLLGSLDGEARGDLFGWSLAGGGDIDGDGLADFAVGARDYDYQGRNSPCAPLGSGGRLVGCAYLYRGQGNSLFARITGEEQRDHFGWSLDFLPDLDANGRDEFAVGALAWPKTALAQCSCPLIGGQVPSECDELGRAYVFRY